MSELRLGEPMTYATLCSGIEGFGLGFDRAGMECVFQCEVDRNCLRVLRKHYPDVTRCEDVNDQRAADELIRLRPGVVAFGSPCQDLSVAGRRGGLAAERSGLFFRCVELCFACETPWVVWENVPGVFSSRGGEDFASVLEAFTGVRPEVPPNGWRNTGVCVGPLYSVAWCVLDAQWFGVPQRRRRVFVVGCLGDRAGGYEVLSLGASLPWDSPPRREARPGVAPILEVDARTGGRPGEMQRDGIGVGQEGDPMFTLQAGKQHGVAYGGNNTAGPIDQAEALNAKGGTGRGTPLVPVPFDTTQVTSDKNYSSPKPGDARHPLAAGAHPPAVAYRTSGNGEVMEQGDKTAALNCGTDPTQNIVGYQLELVNQGSGGNRGWAEAHEPAPTLQTSGVSGVSVVSGARRLTPRECERLQGFPDDWTRFDNDGKEIADGPRYKMLGNAVAVPVAEWIGRRIVEASRE